jgi:predicted ATPase
MLVAISGSQGSGKSTVLNKLAELGHSIVERKTSRSIMADWEVTLQEVNGDRELTLRFQDEIIKRKYEDELQYIGTEQVWFTERTYADLFTYALVSLGKDNINSDWINRYYNLCCQYQRSYSKVFYIRAGIFDVQADGVRGDNVHYSTMVDETMRKFTWMMSPDTKSYREITTGHIDDRVDFILEHAYNR